MPEGNPYPLQEPQLSWGQHTRLVEAQELKNWAMSGIGEKTSRVSWNFWQSMALRYWNEQKLHTVVWRVFRT